MFGGFFYIFWFGTRDFLAVPDGQNLPLGCNGILSLVRFSEVSMPTLSAFTLPRAPCTIRIVTFESSGPSCGQSRWYGRGVQPVATADGNKVTLHLQPTAWNPWFLETYYNSMQCDILVQISDTTSVIVKTSYADPVVLVAENVSLHALSLQPANPACDFTLLERQDMSVFSNLTSPAYNIFDPTCFTSVLNAGQHRVYAQSVNIAALLTIATNDGVWIQDLTMPTDAFAYFVVHDSVLDLTTRDSPHFDLYSENDAVCLVTAQPSNLSLETSEVQVAMQATQGSSVSGIYSTNFLNMTRRSGRFPCAAQGALVSLMCNEGRWNAFATGSLGSVGIHRGLLGAEMPPGPDLSQNVFQGRAFANGRYTFANHSDLVRGTFDYAYIDVDGLGMMDGGMQVL